MPKGRLYVPPTERDGIWYQHRGIPDPGPPYREHSTSTGLMLTAPFGPDTCCYPPNPPLQYQLKNSRNFKTFNRFSAHDNRNSFQDHGVYFGDGQDSRVLGRHLTAPEGRQHSTSREFLKHYGRKQVDSDFKTMYAQSYRGSPCKKPPSHRRFVKTFPELEANNSGLAKLSTTTTSLYTEPDVPHKTPTHVLAVSQEPFLRTNRWKYSYHGLPKCYPSYGRLDGQKHIPSWLLPRVEDADLNAQKTLA